MAVDIKKLLSQLNERKETVLVWALVAVVFSLGFYLLLGQVGGGVEAPSELEVIVPPKKAVVSKETAAKEVIREIKKTQRIPPFIYYGNILAKSLFLKSRAAVGGSEGGVGTGGFDLKGLFDYGKGNLAAVINDPGGKPHLVRVGQRIGASEVKVVNIDFKNQSATLMGKGWEKPQVIRLTREKVAETGGMITFKPSEKKKEVGGPAKVTEEEAKKAIAEAKKALSEASDAILTARSEGADTDDAEARRDDAKVKLEDAQEAMREKDYKSAKESAKSAQALAQEAKRLVGEAEEEAEEEEIIGEREEREEGGGGGGGLAP